VTPVDEHDWLAERFEAHRTHLRSVAYQMLGSASEADDAVQEAWIRLSRSGADDVENLVGLTWAPGGHPKAVFDLTIVDGRIMAVELILDPDHINNLDVVLLDA
jgi:hypothetical protein